MVRVYGYAGSINVRKVLWMCDELDLAVEREDWGGRFRSTSEPAFRALNPVGMVPVLVDDDGTVVWESNAIVRYLAASRGRTDLVPASPRERARVEQWMDWQASDLNNSWRAPFQVLVRGNAAHADARAVDAGVAQIAANLRVVDAQLAATGAYLLGATFTAADLVIALSIERCRAIPVPWPAVPDVDRYTARLRERPGFVRHGEAA